MYEIPPILCKQMVINGAMKLVGFWTLAHNIPTLMRIYILTCTKRKKPKPFITFNPNVWYIEFTCRSVLLVKHWNFLSYLLAKRQAQWQKLVSFLIGA
jgi:hypothetical protein